MKKNTFKRLLSVILTVAMMATMAMPAMAAESDEVSFTKVDNNSVTAQIPGREPVERPQEEAPYDDQDVVRVSIFLEKAGTIDAGFDPADIALNSAAMSYRANLNQDQQIVIQAIENATNEELDVVWNLTLAANLISANVKYGQIEAIEAVEGVRNVVIETQYSPDVASVGGEDPNMATSCEQVGSSAAWAAGYTGAGSRVAIIDTGLDVQHEAFNPTAYIYSMAFQAGKHGMTPDEYAESVGLMDADEISTVLKQLNAYMRSGVSAADLYVNDKVPFGFNYVDVDLDLSHYNSEHGSHVAGISAANAYVVSDNGFEPALTTTYVQGVAPDAQLLVMKVFGAAGGAFDSDYMAAIEDAIVLGADSVNLSLGSGNPGMTRNANAAYQAIMDSLEGSGVVVTMSAGNSGSWVDASENGVPYLYLDDVSLHAGGSPGTYTNSLGVASVDNAGFTMPYMTVGGNMLAYYESTEYGNVPITTIGGTHEYVFLNSIGTAEEFEALGEELLAGKIAMCFRGTTSFFEKANAAVSMGAAGVIIVNNVSGLFGMNLSGYEYTAPAVSISLEDGMLFQQNGTAVTDDAGNVLYWTGTVDISSGIGTGMYNSEYYTMSSFSSWGVPGSLVMKPEITAPGGSIYSVAGAVPGVIYGHNNYELMSGTSMAAPQVAGMAAVLAQYIRENDLDTKTGLDARTLAQSLLMSTAEPILDGNTGYYYPVLQQGAGLANVGNATMADSYILMLSDATASYADGKVKAELGDDPAQEGVYSFSFTINNLTDVEKTFALSADVFTQNAFAYGNALYLDTWATDLAPTVYWTVNGVAVNSGAALAGLDFNGDGTVNSDDGQALLDYATGVRTELSNMDKADLNEDGTVGSHDSYLFFDLLNNSGATVAPNGTTTVTVTIELSSADHSWLANYENGAYIEAYVYAESLSTSEGVEGTTHSIPVLGFYGNWSDASMYDKGSVMEYMYGLETRAPYLYYSTLAGGYSNGLLITYADDPANEYWFGGNPMVSDETYMPERNAISAVTGDALTMLGFTTIRNAAGAFFEVRNTETGEYYELQDLTGGSPLYSAFYYVNAGVWENTYWQVNMEFTADGIPNNTPIEVGVTAVLEYYVDEDGSIALNELGEGATFSMPMVVDNEAPVLKDVSVSEDKTALNIEVSDNQYVAAVALYDIYGQVLYTYEGSKADAQAGDTVNYALDLAEVNGPSFLLQVYDYANNLTTYEIKTQIGEVVDTIDGIEISETSLVMKKGNTHTLSAIVYPVNAISREVVWSSTNENVLTVDENGVVTAVGEGNAYVIAAAAADESVYAACAVTVIDIAEDLNAIIWDEEGSIWYSQFNTANLPNYEKLSHDMLEDDYIAAACTGPDGTIYASSLDTSTGEGALYTIDPVTYEVTYLNDCIVQGLHIFFSDLTFAPGLFGSGCLLGSYGPYVMVIDPATGESLGIVDEYDTEIVGIATCYGYYDADYNQSTDAVYVILNDGTVVQEIYAGLYDYGMVVPYFYYMYGMRSSFDSGYDVGSAWYFNSAHYDPYNGYLYWSAFEQNVVDNVTLYVVDEMNDFAVYELGKFADSVWPVAGLHQNAFVNDADAAAAKLAEIRAEMEGKELPAVSEIQIEKIEFVTEPKTTGSLNASTSYEAPARPMSDSTVTDDEGTVTVTVTAKDATGADVDSTNGVATVTYDADSLILVGIEVEGDYTSVNAQEGAVTFGYVDMDGIAAGDTVATLVFAVRSTDAETVTVTHEETADELPGYDEVLTLGYEHIHTAIMGAKAPTCTEDGYTGDVYCTDCGKLLSEGEVIPATGHTYSDKYDTDCDVCGEIREVKIDTVAMYRLYNPNSGEHFYTGSTEERDALVAVGWNYEGVAWNAPVIGTPVYRLYNPNAGDHHYTMSADEVEMLVDLGWHYEGVAWNSASANDIPLFRLYNPNAETGNHHYTSSIEERDWLVDLGWILEGIGWFGMLN